MIIAPSGHGQALKGRNQQQWASPIERKTRNQFASGTKFALNRKKNKLI
jgi:hypothetical protein